MFDKTNEIIVSSSKKSKELKDIEKVIAKLELQEKRLVDLYINSSLNVEAINQKNENIKKEITTLTKKRDNMLADSDNKEHTIELLKKINTEPITSYKNNYFMHMWHILSRKSKKEMLNRFISSLEISRNKNYEITIENIRFTDEFISKNNNDFIEYLTSLTQKKTA